MHHPVEHRCQDQAGHADEQQPAIDGVDALEQLAAVLGVGNTGLQPDDVAAVVRRTRSRGGDLAGGPLQLHVEPL